MPLTIAAALLTLWNAVTILFAIFGFLIPILLGFHTWAYITWFGIGFSCISTVMYAFIFGIVFLSREGRTASFDSVLNWEIPHVDIANFMSTAIVGMVLTGITVLPWAFFTHYIRTENLLNDTMITAFTGSADPTMLDYSGLSARGVIAMYASNILTGVVLAVVFASSVRTLLAYYMMHPPQKMLAMFKKAVGK